MNQKLCINCKSNITNRGNRAIRCKTCQEQFRKQLWNIKHNEQKSGRKNKQTYDLYKLIQNMTKSELRSMIATRLNELKYQNKTETIKQLRLEIKIITEQYKILKEQPNDIAVLRCEECGYSGEFKVTETTKLNFNTHNTQIVNCPMCNGKAILTGE